MHPRTRRAQKRRARRRLKKWFRRRAFRRAAAVMGNYIKDRLRGPSFMDRLFPIVGSEYDV